MQQKGLTTQKQAAVAGYMPADAVSLQALGRFAQVPAKTPRCLP